MLLEVYTVDRKDGEDYNDMKIVHIYLISSQLACSYEKTFLIAV